MPHNDEPISAMAHGIQINIRVYLTNDLTTRLANYFITLLSKIIERTYSFIYIHIFPIFSFVNSLGKQNEK